MLLSGRLTGARLARLALEQVGVRHAFGVPGVHTTELYDEFAESTLIQPHLVCHEAGGGFMADAISRVTDTLGCLAVVPAAGLTQSMSALAEAFLDGIPVIVVTGGINRDAGHAHLLHEMDQQKLAAAVIKGYWYARSHAQIAPMIYEAAARALSGVPGPVLVEIPQAILVSAAEVAEPSPFQRPLAPLPPSAEAMQDAVAAIQRMKKPGICVGWGARGARDAVIALAERLQAPVCTSLQGLSSFPADHPLHTGMAFGPAAVPAGEAAFADCDGIVAVGHRFGEVGTGAWSMQMPRNLVQIDIDAQAIGANFPATAGLVGDAAVVVPALNAALAQAGVQRAQDSALFGLIEARKSEYRREWRQHRGSGRVNPLAFFAALDAMLSTQAIVVCDDGNHTFLTAELMPFRGQRRFISPTDFNCMGYGVPAAIAAKLGNPDCDVVGIVGDGAFHMTGNELLTALGMGVGVPIFVFNDGELSQISQAQEIPYVRKTCTVLPAANFEHLAQAYGAEFLAIEDDAGCAEAITRALQWAAVGRTALIDVRIDYSKRTRFTKGVVQSQLRRMPWNTKARFVSRAVWRRVAGTV